ncbi:hypothetical protein HPB47_020950 [Ixodes persulcatus]|uniref:Uncharacterized protein n=1 Tax=Ixodes persulcatus TaxID=34615 RepID=A0AC60QHD9_IXOPE|nr:hypothetical protein HPB47_020950 [Ixodes persulcatus]
MVLGCPKHPKLQDAARLQNRLNSWETAIRASDAEGCSSLCRCVGELALGLRGLEVGALPLAGGLAIQAIRASQGSIGSSAWGADASRWPSCFFGRAHRVLGLEALTLAKGLAVEAILGFSGLGGLGR